MSRMPQHATDAALSERLAAALLAAATVLAATQAGLSADDQAVDDRPLAADDPRARDQGTPIDLGGGFDADVFSIFRIRTKRSGDPANEGERSTASPTSSVVRGIAQIRLEWIDSVCGLREQQRDKLQMVLDSEGRQAAAEIDAERRAYLGVRVNPPEKESQRVLQEFHQAVRRCRERLEHLFGVDSLFSKVLPNTLDPDQQARLAAEEETRRTTRWRAMVAAELQRWDDVLGMSQEQHDRIERLLVAERPPLRAEIPGVLLRRNDHHLGPTLVKVALSRIDSGMLAEVVSPRQGNLLARWARQGQASRSSIESQGWLERVWK